MTDISSLLGWGKGQISPPTPQSASAELTAAPARAAAPRPSVGAPASLLSSLLWGWGPRPQQAGAAPATASVHTRPAPSTQGGTPHLKRDRAPSAPSAGTPYTPSDAGAAAGSTSSHLGGAASGRYGSSARNTGEGTLDPIIKRRAIELFRETQGLTRLLRDPKAALRQTALRPLMAEMSPDQMAQAVVALTRDTGMNKARRSAFTQLDKFYAGKGLEPVYPITLKGALAYSANYVVIKGNLSHVLSTAISNLRRAGTHEGQWDLDADDEAQLEDAVKALKRTLPSEARESEAVDIDRLMVLMNSLALSDDPKDARLGAIIAAAVNLKMRCTEIFGPKGLRREDVREESGGTIFNGRLVKIGEETLAARPRAAPHLPAEYEMLCLSYWLQRYLAAVDPTGTMPAKNFLFCPLDAAGRWTSKQPSDESAAVFELMRTSGVRTEGLNVEWGRHTGHGLHVLRCGLEQPTSNLLGDHAHNSNVGEKHYLHTSAQGSHILMLGARKINAFCKGKVCCQ